MPRVRAPGVNASPSRSNSIPLNDDKREKAQRLQSRQEQYAKQMDKIKAAASPARNKRRSLGGNGPFTPGGSQENEAAFADVANNGPTPLKRVPILANFEEWMRMATDNKINATNSWNFALIDYFHDMSLLKEGDGVNFQKASCTLDGCVKIYTSRVDSVATETGKLLSGLADNNVKKKGSRDDADGDEEGGEDGENDEEDGEGNKKRTKKKSQRSAEATLVSSFDQLRLKKMELEFAVDPLFKKASADFDEGGAKGLLLNHLAIDSTGRIVFDSSDDAAEHAEEDARRDSMEPDQDGEEDKTVQEILAETIPDKPIDIAGLGARFFSSLDELDRLEICPSLMTFQLGGGDNALDLPFLKAPENWREEHLDKKGDQGDSTNLDDDGDDGGMGTFDMPAEIGFGEGGEAWARNNSIQPQLRPHDSGADAGEVGTFDIDSESYGVTLRHRETDEENILNYFDEALQKNWAGPEHWKITRVKEANKPQAPRVRKEKEAFEIDFAAPLAPELAAMLYTPAASNSVISLPRTQWRSKTRHLLPDDKHFNSKDLLKLFLKPKAKLGSRIGAQSRPNPPEGEIDAAYWAANGAQQSADAQQDEPARPDYDANFFQDDNLPMGGNMDDDDDDVFADAREMFSPEMDDVGAALEAVGPGIDGITAGALEGSYGAQLIMQSRRARPEYVQYARVAKKVDIRRLKEEMWVGTGFEKKDETAPTPSRPQAPALAADDHSTLAFTSMMKNLQHVYPKQQLADISTSYGFICLLHLANEKGLVIENVEGWEELQVRRDFDAPLVSSEAS